MSSAAVDIQIVSAPNLDKIENFFKDSSYRETIEFSANFNTRLCVERRHRLPFFDPQTRVAQNHSQLFIDKRQRMPGFRQGQIYTYPAPRWRKSRRQYLNKMYRFPDRPFQALRKEQDTNSNTTASGIAGTASPLVCVSATSSLLDGELNATLLDESISLGAAGGDTSDSKDSQPMVAQQKEQQQLQSQSQPQLQQQTMKDDLPKEWFYDDIEMHELDGLDEPKSPADDEFDYDPRYGTKKRRKRKPYTKRANTTATGGEDTPRPGPGRRRTGGTRGRGASLAAAVAAGVAAANADASLTATLDTTDGSNSMTASEMATTSTATTVANATATTTTTPKTRRPRGTGGKRGRRRTKGNPAGACDPPSPGLNREPPSFDSIAAAVGVMGGVGTGAGGDMSVVGMGVGMVMNDDDDDLLINYRKFL